MKKILYPLLLVLYETFDAQEFADKISTYIQLILLLMLFAGSVPDVHQGAVVDRRLRPSEPQASAEPSGCGEVGSIHGPPRRDQAGRVRQRPHRAARLHLPDEEPQVHLPLAEQTRVLAQGAPVQLSLAGRNATSGTQVFAHEFMSGLNPVYKNHHKRPSTKQTSARLSSRSQN